MTITAEGTLSTLFDRFIRATWCTHPGKPLRWGYAPGPEELLPRDFGQVSAELQELEAGLIAQASSDMEAAMLLRSVRERRFELDVLMEWRYRPYYYVQKRLVGILETLSGPAAGNAGSEMLVKWIRAIPAEVEAALSNLALPQLAKLDAMWAAHMLRCFAQAQLPRLLSNLPLSEHERKVAAVSWKDLADILAETGDAAAFTTPVGREMISDWVETHSGLRIDAEKLEAECVRFLGTHSGSLAKVTRTQDATPSTDWIDDAQVRRLCLEIQERLAPWFELDQSLLTDLAIRRLEGQLSSAPRAGYSSGPYVTDQPTPTLLYKPGHMHNRARLEVDLVHEIFPGHHWERTYFYRRWRGQSGCLTYENYCYLEGWARYCERLYAEAVGTPEVTRTVDGDLAIAAMKALAVLWSHGGRKSFRSAVADLSHLTGLAPAKVQSTVIEAYLTPIQKIAPMVGYMAFRQIADQDDRCSMHRQVSVAGPTLLWGVSL